MVIGGGPGGMMAAQTLRAMGHRVSLYEKSHRLGGLLNDATVASFKEYMRLYLQWDIRQTMQCGAEIHLDTEVTPELVEQVNPDAVIVASGSTYVYPNIPGIEMDKVKTVSDVENHRVPVGENVVVCGGGIVGLECAVMLGMEGKKVTVIDQIPLEKFADGMPVFNHIELNYQLEKYGVTLVGGQKITSFGGKRRRDRGCIRGKAGLCGRYLCAGPGGKAGQPTGPAAPFRLCRGHLCGGRLRVHRAAAGGRQSGGIPRSHSHSVICTNFLSKNRRCHQWTAAVLYNSYIKCGENHEKRYIRMT